MSRSDRKDIVMTARKGTKTDSLELVRTDEKTKVKDVTADKQGTWDELLKEEREVYTVDTHNFYAEEAALKQQIEELKAKKHMAEVEKLNKLGEVAAKKIDYIRRHKDIILPLISHTNASCAKNSNNGFYRNSYGEQDYECPRCALEELLNDEYEARNWNVSFEVTLEKLDK